MPQIGELSPGLWLASGFGGHGFNTTAMAGNMIARAIVEGDDNWRLFLPYELIWSGGRVGRVAAQVGYWWSRARLEIKARNVRLREAGSHHIEPAPEPLAETDEPAGQAEDAMERPVADMEVPGADYPVDPASQPQPAHMATPTFREDDVPPTGRRPMTHA